MSSASPSRPRVLLGICGSSASFKAAMIASRLTQEGCEVRCILTESATQFLRPLALTALTDAPVYEALWDPKAVGELHVKLARWADCCLVAPATQRLLCRTALGLGDDLLSTTLPLLTGPRWLAPAMHSAMWQSEATQDAAARLSRAGFAFLGPTDGRLADGSEGPGRLSEPESCIARVLDSLAAPAWQDLTGMHLVITAGASEEAIDPVRSIRNRSSGRTGRALCEAALARGARVTLLHGWMDAPPPEGVSACFAPNHASLQQALDALPTGVDAIVMAAAVADFKAASISTHKLQRGAGSQALELCPQRDILQGLGQARRADAGPLLVGFALEEEELAERGRRKLERKQVDLIVANRIEEALEGDQTRVVFVDHDGDEARPPESKRAMAHALLSRIRILHKRRVSRTPAATGPTQARSA